MPLLFPDPVENDFSPVIPSMQHKKDRSYITFFRDKTSGPFGQLYIKSIYMIDFIYLNAECQYLFSDIIIFGQLGP